MSRPPVLSADAKSEREAPRAEVDEFMIARVDKIRMLIGTKNDWAFWHLSAEKQEQFWKEKKMVSEWREELRRQNKATAVKQIAAFKYVPAKRCCGDTTVRAAEKTEEERLASKSSLSCGERRLREPPLEQPEQVTEQTLMTPDLRGRRGNRMSSGPEDPHGQGGPDVKDIVPTPTPSSSSRVAKAHSSCRGIVSQHTSEIEGRVA